MSEDIEDYKIILIGNVEVGKTTLLKKLSTGKFRDFYFATISYDKSNFQYQITIEKKRNKKEEKNFGFNLFDLSGSEKFRELIYHQFKGNDDMIDITNRNSFNSIENWINIINERNPPKDGKINYVTMIIGNKLDLINENNNLRHVTEEEAKIFVKKII